MKYFNITFTTCALIISINLLFTSSYVSKGLNYHSFLWVYNVENNTLNKLAESNNEVKIETNLFYYYNTNAFLYNHNGAITSRLSIKTNEYLSRASNSYLLYSKSGQQIELFSNLENPIKVWGFDALSYGYLSPSGNRIFLLTTDNSSFSLINENSFTIVSNQFVSTMITDFEFCKFDDSVIISTIEGDIIKIDENGKKVFHYSLKKDMEKNRKLSIKYLVAKTISTSEHGRYTAGAVGLQQEYTMLFDKKGNILWQVTNIENNLTKINFKILEKKKKILQQNKHSFLIRKLNNGKISHKFFYNGTNFYHAKAKEKIKADFLNYQIVDSSFATYKKHYLFLANVTTANNNNVFVFVFDEKNNKIIFQKDFANTYVIGGTLKNKLINIQMTNQIYHLEFY